MFLSGCMSAQMACIEEWKQRNPDLTKDELLALFYGAKGKGCIHEWYFMVEKDGAPPKIAYKKIKLADVLALDEKQLRDIDDILDPRKEANFRLLEETGLRPYFEAQERAMKFRVSRLKLKVNHEKFKKLIGEGGMEMYYGGVDHRQGYDVNIFLPEFDPSKETPFMPKYLEEARKD